tara:strand:- start:28 stop:1563 length:1536 start_codon:yes stop_codon:yes gene_type:complete
MNSATILSIIALYFLILYIISYFTGKDDSNNVFFNAGRSSKWYIVAFGMVGASLSGVTFISVPGWIESSQFSYLQVVLGYFVGYIVVCYVLLPVYYKLNVTSIYEYLDVRFGKSAHITGAFYFFISRLLGASFRLFLVAIVLQQFVFDSWNIPFPVTVGISIGLIWIYTFKGGIKTIVWTDTLQTLFMILAVIISIISILNSIDLSLSEYFFSDEFKRFNKVFFTEDFNQRNHFLKSFVGGIFVTICMTGLDQDMMQKNLTCKSLEDAQKNMISFSIVLVLVTALFMFLGSLLFTYQDINSIIIPSMDGQIRTDLLFPEIALNSELGIILGISFLLGLIAAAYSSADSALTSLTTSFCIDFLGMSQDKNQNKKTRKIVHVGMSMILMVTIIIFKYVLSSNVIDSLLTVASYTYGPLLGLFAFGLYTNRKLIGNYIYLVVILAPILTYLINISPTLYAYLSEQVILECKFKSWICAGAYAKEHFYIFGYELLPLNGLITVIGLYICSKNKNE